MKQSITVFLRFEARPGAQAVLTQKFFEGFALNAMRLCFAPNGNGYPEASTHGGFAHPKLKYDTHAIKINTAQSSPDDSF